MMPSMNIQHAAQLLTQDVAPLGALSAPLVSWLGSAGLTAFFLWQAARLYRVSTQTAQPFARVTRCLNTLAHERRQLDQDGGALHAPEALKRKPQASPPHLDRRDRKDLHLIDATFQREPWLSPAWTQYRKTLVTEQVAWYIEPRIFSSRSAQELFSLETIFRGKLNLAWYQQVPSLMTGIGLLLTFIALLIGLSKLHADGHGIAGIQGLINGLAGKFLTSIVGLVCATAFTLIEKPLMFRVFSAHQQCTHLIDDLFPRKTLEQILEGMTGTFRRPSSLEQGLSPAPSISYAQPATDALLQPLKAMTKSVDALTQEIRAHLLTSNAPPNTYPTDAIATSLAPLIQQLTLAATQLPHRVEPLPAQRVSSPQEVDHLVDDLTARIAHAPQATTRAAQRRPQGWLQRLRASTQLLTPLAAIAPGRTHPSRSPR
ncbi:MAG: hypothetical protein IT389_12960 [Nitrospira sp.]|nr:hypothetical protein [Nitrospira sp.]